MLGDTLTAIAHLPSRGTGPSGEGSGVSAPQPRQLGTTVSAMSLVIALVPRPARAPAPSKTSINGRGIRSERSRRAKKSGAPTWGLHLLEKGQDRLAGGGRRRPAFFTRPATNAGALLRACCQQVGRALEQLVHEALRHFHRLLRASTQTLTPFRDRPGVVPAPVIHAQARRRSRGERTVAEP